MRCQNKNGHGYEASDRETGSSCEGTSGSLNNLSFENNEKKGKKKDELSPGAEVLS